MDVTDGDQLRLFEKRQRKSAPKILHLAPSEDELGEALLWGSRLAVQKRLIGDIPGMDRDDVASVLAIMAMKSVSAWRGGGKKTLREYAYVKCGYCLIDFLKKRKKRDDDEGPDVIDSLFTVCYDENLNDGKLLVDRWGKFY